MNVNHIVSLTLALFAALLVIVAGRSCARSIDEANKESRAEKRNYHLITENPYTRGEQPVMTAAPQEPQQPVETTTERQYETVTNMFGEVIETIPVTSPEEANIPTTTLSILDEYNQSIGGGLNDAPEYNGEYPTDYIAPATNITIHLG